ncbi:hypothetical protein [Streptomyces sp. NPDC101166]|uniref:hypothetical protein n=1 Tax=Streptomyces sp. NPDC101166 TaxID=3366120 RepID=UPI0037FC0F70
MSLADLLPVRFGLADRAARHPQHRAIDKVERLEVLLAGAKALIKGLGVQLDEQARAHEETVARIDARHAETVRGLEEQVAELQRRLNVRVLAEHVIAQTQEIPVAALWEARADGLLGPVTDPSRATR